MESHVVVDNIKYKDPEDEEGMAQIHFLLAMVLLDMAFWHYERDLEMVVTDLISTEAEDIVLDRESDAHRTKRAADLRCKHLSDIQRAEFKHYFNNKYADIASVSRSDNRPRLVVEHGVGPNRHFHIALNFKYRITE